MNKQGGVTLLETLIAILVLSFGLLGMLGVIINSLKMTSSSNYRTIAAEQAYSMADILRGTPFLLASYNSPSASSNTSCVSASGCTQGDMISMQYYQWRELLGKSLPQGNGTICRDSTPDDGSPTNWACDGSGPFVVKVCWNEARLAITSSGQGQGYSNGIYCTWTNI